jgi:hypothetical protein
LRIVEIGGLRLGARTACRIVRQGGLPGFAELGFKFALDERAQSRDRQLETLTDAIAIR